jgi:hypothetical protein
MTRSKGKKSQLTISVDNGKLQGFAEIPAKVTRAVL